MKIKMEACKLQTVEMIKIKLKLLGLEKAIIERDGINKDRISIQIPSLLIKNPERVKNIIKTRGFLEFRLVEAGPAPDKEALLQDYGGEVPDDMEVAKFGTKWAEGGQYFLSQMAIITGGDFRSVRVSKDEWNTPAVQVNFKPEFARRFYKFTSENLGKPLSIVLDGKALMVATIRDKISDSAIIHINFTVKEDEDLALILRSGGLPARIKYLEEKIIENL